MPLVLAVLAGLILLGKYGPGRILRPVFLGAWYLIKGLFWVAIGVVGLIFVIGAVLSLIFGR